MRRLLTLRRLLAVVALATSLLVLGVILLWHWIVAGAIGLAAWKMLWRRAERL